MENSCGYLKYVDGYAHGELGGNILSEFQNHLEACADCRKELESVESLRSAMVHSFEVSLDETFNYSVVNELRNKKAAEPVREIRIALEDIIVSLATLLVIVLIGIQIFNKPKVSSVEMAGSLTKIEKSSLEQTRLSNDQVLELVLGSK
jgi:Putative zinc-finger